MRLIYPLAAGAILGACLAGWVALAWGQQKSPEAPASSQVPMLPAAAEPSALPVPNPAPASPAAVEPPPPAPTPLPPAEEPPPKPEGWQKAVNEPKPIPPLLQPPPTQPTPEPAQIFPPPASPAGPRLPGAPENQLPPAPGLPPMPNLLREAQAVQDSLLRPASALPAAPNIPASPPPGPAAPPALPAESTMGKQEPAVSVEWIGPQIAKLGTPSDYILDIRNTSTGTVHDAKAQVLLPPGLRLVAAEPRPGDDGQWSLGQLEAKQEKIIQMKLVADVRGDLTPQAAVHFTSVASMRVKVHEPKLFVKAAVVDKVMLGDMAAFTLTVSNPGDGTADQVRIQAMLSEGLEHARGPKLEFEIGSLAAGEARSVQITCATRLGGMQICKATATADGDLNATATASVSVMLPRLDLQITGPGLRYLDRKALYTIKVGNPGDAPANNVTIADVVPAGFKVLAASCGGRHDANTRTVSWFIGEIAPGQAREVQVEVLAVNPGRHTHKATAVGTRNLHAEGECTTNVEGLPALEVVLNCTENPVEVNGETAYDIHISNTGSKTETDIKLVAEVPAQMRFKNATGPVSCRIEGNRIVFDSLPTLAPRGEAVFRVYVRAVEPGTVRFKIQLTSTNVMEPVIQMEATRIYADAPEAPKP